EKRETTKYWRAPTLFTTAFDRPSAKDERASAKVSYFWYLSCSPSRYSAPEDCATAASFLALKSLSVRMLLFSTRSAANRDTRLADNNETSARLVSIQTTATSWPRGVFGVLSP